jgi:hypothetical protein
MVLNVKWQNDYFFFVGKADTCPHYRITLNSEARLDMQMWYEFARNFNGKCLKIGYILMC